MTTPPSPRRFEALDGWRGLCALSVVLFHLNARSHLYALTRNAWVAVDFFFVLSGFVLMAGFGGKVGDASAFRRFALRRLARLYPLHLAMLAATFALAAFASWRGDAPLFEGAHSLSGLVQNLILVHGFTLQALSWNFPSWSISLELWASLLFGLVLWAAGARAWIVLALAGAGLAALVFRLGEPAGPAVTEAGALLKAAHYLMAFCIGAALFRLYRDTARRGLSPPPWVEWPALALAVAAFLFADRAPSPGSVALFALVIFVFAHEAGPVSAALRGRWPQALGRWSYSIYLVHPLFTLAAFSLISRLGDHLGRPATVTDTSGAKLVLGGPFAMDLASALCLGAVVAAAAFAYRFIERPGMALAAPRQAERTPDQAWPRRAPRTRAT